ncbi:MAG: outer rane beta-barrel protein, partial [Bacteroidota bacterium]|nr:outer rane beta-barrel protein [Bacteroidota bacterium]
ILLDFLLYVRPVKTLLLFISLFAFSFCVSAKESLFSISGTVVDSTSGKAVELATITLKADGDEKIISGATADGDGNFQLDKVKAGKYKLGISFVGYPSKIISVEINSNVQLGKIYLSSGSKTLGETEISATKSLITKNAEKTVFNVAQSPSNQVGTAEDVLRNMPGVSVDQKGNVSILGKQGIKILVDGLPNALAQSDLPSFLKSIPASSIEAIELITNPSAKYDAEGNAGIINIKLKKGKTDGLNGSLSAGYGILDRYNATANINYRKKKINVFADYAFNYGKSTNRYIEGRTISLNDTTSYYNLDSKGTETHMNNSLKAGIDYFINDKNTLTYTVGGNYSNFHWYSDALGQSFGSTENKMASYNSTDDEKNNNFSISNDITYRKKFDTTEHELDIDISHTYVKGGNDARLNSLGYDSIGAYSLANSLQRHTSSGNNIHNFIFQLDYIHPLKKLKGYKIEAGVKNETTLNRNVFNAYTVANNVELFDSLLSNNFNYTENIAAAYGIMSGTWKKLLSYSAGLRMEHTYIQSNNNSVSKNYFSFFPSASLAAAFSETQSLSASYSRRVQRPQFRQINNTISYIDQYSTWQGNSFLQPSFSHIVSLNYTAMVKQHMFSLEASGNFQSDGFIESTRVDSNRISRGGVANGTNSKTFNFTFYTKLQLTKWWDLQLNHAYTYSYYGFKEGLNTAPISGHSYMLWMNTSFTFWKKTVIEISGWFNSGGVQPQGTTKLSGVLNASIKKSFFKDRLTISVAGHNLLQTMHWHWTVNNSGIQTNGSWQSFERNVMFTLTYRFGSNAQAQQRREKESNDRLGGDGKAR